MLTRKPCGQFIDHTKIKTYGYLAFESNPNGKSEQVIQSDPWFIGSVFGVLKYVDLRADRDFRYLVD